MARLKLVQSGVARKRAHSGIARADGRLPITVQILRGLVRTWQPPHNRLDPTARAEGHDCLLLRASAVVRFFGFFRSGEITVPTASGFDERAHLAWGDVAVGRSRPPEAIKVHLKRSKCDQLGKGVDVYIGRTGTEVCPVNLTLQYVAERGPSPGPFFRRSDGSPLTKAFFVASVRQALVRLGVDPRSYAGHSFRIGAATAAAEAGVEDSVIQSLGRWNSTAFLRYIRTPRERLAAFTGQLAAVNNQGR